MELETDQMQSARYALLLRVVLLLTNIPDWHHFLESFVNKMREGLDFDYCTIAWLNRESHTYKLQTVFEKGRYALHMDEAAVPVEQGISGAVIRSRQARLVNDMNALQDET